MEALNNEFVENATTCPFCKPSIDADALSKLQVSLFSTISRFNA